jgi:hypothetical protein
MLKRSSNELILQTSDNVRSKEKWKNINTHPIFIDHHFLLYTGLAIELIIKYLFTNFLMWSQITFLLSIRRTGSRQIDFKVFKPLKVENILES